MQEGLGYQYILNRLPLSRLPALVVHVRQRERERGKENEGVRE